MNRKYKERQGEKNWIHICLFASYALCLWLCVCVCLCLYMCVLTHELHICPDLVGSTDWFWAPGLLQTEPGQNVRSQPLDTHKFTQTQSCGEQCGLVFANVPPNAVDTHHVYVPRAHFSIGCLINLTRRWKISGTFVQQCLCLINDSFGEKSDQGHARSIYFKQPLTHPGAWLNSWSSLFSSRVNCTSASSNPFCLLVYLHFHVTSLPQKSLIDLKYLYVSLSLSLHPHHFFSPSSL